MVAGGSRPIAQGFGTVGPTGNGADPADHSPCAGSAGARRCGALVELRRTADSGRTCRQMRRRSAATPPGCCQDWSSGIPAASATNSTPTPRPPVSPICWPFPGSHFAILCGIVVVVLRRFGPRLLRWAASPHLSGLVILVGPQPSVLRAALMGGIGMLALLTGRNRSVRPGIGGAVIVLLLRRSDIGDQRRFCLVGAGYCRADSDCPGVVGSAATTKGPARLGRCAGRSGCGSDRHHAGDRADQRDGVGRRGTGKSPGCAGRCARPGARCAVRAHRAMVVRRSRGCWLSWPSRS